MGVVGRLDQYASMLAWEFDDYSMSENLLTYSNISSANWNANNSAVLTNNSSTSPDGTVNATQIAAPATVGSGVFRTFSLTSATVYTYSLFVKAVSGSNTIYFGTDTGTTALVQINTSTGVSSLYSGSPTNITSIPYPNSWYRVSFTFTASATATHSFVIYNLTANANTWLAWGAQVEAGSVATEYTPTTTTAINRVLASTTNTNITGLGTYYSSGFDENVGFTTFLSANIFPPYDLVYDEFGGTLFGAGQGRYKRQNTDKSVIVYNDIDEITDFRDIVRTGMVLDLDAGMNSSFNNTGTTWYDLSNSSSSAVSVGQSEYTTTGTYTFIVPYGVTSLSAVVIGGGGGGAGADSTDAVNATNGGGGGGGLAYGTIAVTPGESLTITVGTGGTAGPADGNGGAGGTSTIVRSATTLLSGGGGTGGIFANMGNSTGGTSGGTDRIGGGSGGAGGTQSGNSGATGGGGAGGYSGNGGSGGIYNAAGSASTGGGGGGGGGRSGTSLNFRAGGGGGVGILGSGSNGTGGTSLIGGGGSGGSSGGGGSSGAVGGTGAGGLYGGGGGGKAEEIIGTTVAGGAGRNGAVRIIWGSGRSYPSTIVTYQPTVVGVATTSNNAQLINAPTYSSANGGYFVFNGTNQYVTSPFATTSGQAVTYCGWLYSTETTATYRNFVDSSTVNPMIWWNTTGQIEFDAALYTTTAVYRNQWVYVALSKPSGNSSPSYYVNGVLVGSGTAYTTPTVTPTWFNREGAQTWIGNASHVQAYNRVLSASEVSQNYNALKHRFGL